MAGSTEVRAFQVTCPINTTAAAPQITNIAMPTRTVLNIFIQVPTGPNGVMGFALGSAGQAVIPVVAGTWIVASDRQINWALKEQIDSGAWQVQMYNTGLYPHTIYIEFTVEVPDQPDSTELTQPAVVAAVLPAATVTVDTTTTPLPVAPELT